MYMYMYTYKKTVACTLTTAPPSRTVLVPTARPGLLDWTLYVVIKPTSVLSLI
uniref:Uncharacterized protein n=1 Tax=Amphimedon queenslandica TaxID=400682 RepID=A0A1X7VF04_AMPQE